jgi:hypothetical protein
MYASVGGGGGATGLAFAFDGSEDAAPIPAVKISARSTVADFLNDLIWAVPGCRFLV